jgi:cytochrome c oxidase assembly protein subunit 15
MKNNPQKPIALWLLVCCALIFAMVVLGGVTRLTRSGLSMVEWDPIMGVVPPLNHSQWEETFAKYKLTPEYQKMNLGMSLAEFKNIFWFEYAHRILGRLIGLVFLLPFLYFLFRKKIDKPLVPKMVTMFVLGGLQGLLGWYMVKSGLVNDPHVSPYRLTAHFAFAVVIYAYILWVALDLLAPARSAAVYEAQPLRRFGFAVTALVFLMMLSGGFVAGTKAGFAFNTFPLMNGHWIPPGLYALDPVWVNLFENIATVQFNHRLIAYLLILIIPVYWFYARRFSLTARTRLFFHLLVAVLGIQVLLGIATLVQVVPVPLAAAHQAGALLLFTVALGINHALSRKSV